MPSELDEDHGTSREANWFTYGANWVRFGIVPNFDEDGMVTDRATVGIWVIDETQ